MKMIKTRNALKICYYMMAADGLVQDSERAKFDELGVMLDEQFPKYKEQLVWECKQKGLFSPDREIVFLIMDYVEKELEEGIVDSIFEDTIPGRLLIWNMLTIALCDKDYTDAEKRVIHDAVRLLEIDEADFREMEHTLIAANAVAREESFLKEAEQGNPDIQLQLKNLKERGRIISANAREQIRKKEQ